MKVFDSLNQAISSGRERRKKEMAVLKDSRRTYLTLRPFPDASEGGADKQARLLCLTDALIGSMILTALFLVFYPALFIAVSVTFSILNWRRYSLQRFEKKVEIHEN